MPSDISDKQPGKLRLLNGVLDQWITLNMDRTDWGKDAPWWYNERACLSQFVGAVWRTRGGWAFEEYTVNKKVRLADGRFVYPRKADGQKRPHGRVDVAFELPNFCAIAEAKIVWPEVKPGADGVELQRKLQRAMSSAHEQIPHYPDSAGRYQRLGILFVVPHVSTPALADRCIEIVLAEIRKTEWTSAWAFPKAARRLKSKNGGYYPGIAVCVASL